MSEQALPVAATSNQDAGAQRAADILEGHSESNKITIRIFARLCKGCEICAEVCPKSVLRMEVAPDRWEGTIVKIVDMEACNACMLCEYQCPDFAIEVHSLKKELKAREKKQVA